MKENTNESHQNMVHQIYWITQTNYALKYKYKYKNTNENKTQIVRVTG